jgi:hypothetical protein
MAIITISNTGGIWTSTTAWVGGVIPTAVDDVVATATSGPLTVSSSASVAKSVDFTNYVNTFAINAILSIAGNLTLSAGMTITGTVGSLAFTANATWTSNGKTWTGNYLVNTASLTITLADNAIIGGNTTHSSGGLTHTFNGSTISFNGNVTASSGRVFAGTTTYRFTTATTQAITGQFQSDVVIIATGTVTLTNLIFTPATNKTITYTSGIIPPGTGILTLTPTAAFTVTLNTGGMTWNNVTLPSSASTIILNSIFTVGGTATSSQSIIYSGTSGFDYYNWTSSINNTRTWTLVSGVSYRMRNSMLSIGGASVASKNAFVSSIPGSQAILTVDQGATIDLQYLYATDIDSSLGRTIWSYKGVLSNTLNWKNLPPNGPGTISYTS